MRAFAFAAGCLVAATVFATDPRSVPGSGKQSVVGTVHNLSVSGPGQVKSTTETEVCKFCHIPHSAVEIESLWSHTLSDVASYKVPPRRRGDLEQSVPQPDGASRLCLSCHDGTVALGDIGGRRRGPGGPLPTRLKEGSPGFLGTDLSGGHPISITMSGEPPVAGRDIGTRPPEMLSADAKIRLDSKGKLQCTTCHDPHDDSSFREGSVPHFWVGTTITEVCLGCHELR